MELCCRIDPLLRDVRQAVRRLAAAPMFTAFAIVSLAVGVGITVATVSIVDTVFFISSGIPQADKVAFVAGTGTQNARMQWRDQMSPADYEHVASTQQAFGSIAAVSYFHDTLVSDAVSEQILGEAVTRDYFRTLGVEAALGRTLGEADEAGSAAVVFSHNAWMRHFNGDRSVVGRVIRLGGQALEIAGVAARGFVGTQMVMPNRTSVWIPLRTLPRVSQQLVTSLRPPNERRALSVIGRVASTETLQQAAAELAVIGTRLDATLPIYTTTIRGERLPTTRSWYVVTAEAAHAGLTAGVRRFGMLITMVVAMVLLVACTNLANLTLARAVSRRQDLAVRRALGASRWRLVREQLAESSVLTAAGGLGALVVARLLLVATPDIPLARGWSAAVGEDLSWAAVAASAVAAVIAVLVFGLIPAIQITQGHGRDGLGKASASVGPGYTQSQRRAIRWQVAIASTFFILSTMALGSVIRQMRHDAGVDLDGMAVAGVYFLPTQGWDETRGRRAVDAILENARANRELAATAVSSGLPFGTTVTPHASLARPGEPFREKSLDTMAIAISVTPGFFDATGVQLLAGRPIDHRDAAGARPVIVMGATTARQLFGTADVVGRDVQLKSWRPGVPEGAPELVSIVGVARDADTTHLMRRRDGIIYRPLAQKWWPALTIVSRAATSAAALAGLRAALRATDPDLPISDSGTGFLMLAGFYITARIAAVLSGSLGLLALVLSMTGLHGVLAQMVSSRVREIGLRIALGAERAQIARMTLSDGFRPVIQGLALGAFFGIVGRFVARATAFPAVDALDPLPILFLPVPVVIAAFAACYFPARRAAQVDPNVALRAL